MRRLSPFSSRQFAVTSPKKSSDTSANRSPWYDTLAETSRESLKSRE